MKKSFGFITCIIAITFLSILTSCRPRAQSSATTIAGQVILLAPVSGVYVRVINYRPTGIEDIIGETVTNEKGEFSFNLNDGEGTIRIEALGTRGGNTKEPISNIDLSLSNADTLMLIKNNIELGGKFENLIISPWTTLVAAKALWDAKTQQKEIGEAYENASRQFSQHFGNRSFFESAPADPTVAPLDGLSSSALHGFAIVGLCAAGNDLSKSLKLRPGGVINTLSITRMLTDDLLADGAFNGIGQAGKITIIDNIGLGVEYTRHNLANSLGAFLTTPENRSGIRLTDLTPFMAAIKNDTSDLYAWPLRKDEEGPGTDPSADPVLSIGDGAQITLTSPRVNALYQGQVTITAQAQSNLGVAGFDVILDDKIISNGTRINNNLMTIDQNFDVSDGFHLLKVKAKTTFGIESSVVVPLTSDKTLPVITMKRCVAYDDLKREKPGTDPFTVSVVQWKNPVIDNNCAPDKFTKENAYRFNTYADLAQSNDTSSQLVLTIIDNGIIQTNSTQLKSTAGIYKNNRLITNTVTLMPPNDAITTHTLPLSRAFWGEGLMSASSQELLELRINSQDNAGNTAHASYYFFLNFIPVPLLVKELALDNPAELISTYSFESKEKNIAKIGDPTLPLVNQSFTVSKYEIKNPSDRTALIQLVLDDQLIEGELRRWHGLAAQDGSYDNTTRHYLPNYKPLGSETCKNDIPATDTWKWGGVPLGSDPFIMAQLPSGEHRCMRISEYMHLYDPRGGITLTTTTPWVINLVDQKSNEIIFPNPTTHEWILSPHGTFTLIVGFLQPDFGSHTSTTCFTRYAVPTDIYLGVALYSLASYTSQAYNNHGGFLPYKPLAGFFGSPDWGTPDNLDRNFGEIDCLGVRCVGTECLIEPEKSNPNYMYLHVNRVDSTGKYDAIKDQYLYRYTHWLSRVLIDHSVKLSGQTSIIKTALRFPFNTTEFSDFFPLPLKNFKLDYQSINPEPLPSRIYLISQEPLK